MIVSANKEGEVMAIDQRKIRILQAIINDYIITGEPIGSRTIAKRYDLGVGSATIRNEMADLEEMGYLEQPHASAGRIPSSKGYRLYVDNLMEMTELTPEEEIQIKQHILDSALHEVDKIVKEACTLLSELTNLTCVIKTPAVNKSCIKSIQLLKIDSFNLIYIIVTDSGVIKNHRIKISQSPSDEDLYKINLILNSLLKNLTIEDINLEVINNIKSKMVGFDELFNAMLPALYETLKESAGSDVLLEGTTNIFNYPEYNDIEKAKNILSLLYNKDCVIELLEPNGDLTIKIGEENYFPEAKECSIISAEYTLGGRTLGSIGLIGPRRINYSKVVAIMAKVMKELNNTLSTHSIE